MILILLNNLNFLGQIVSLILFSTILFNRSLIKILSIKAVLVSLTFTLFPHKPIIKRL